MLFLKIIISIASTKSISYIALFDKELNEVNDEKNSLKIKSILIF